MYDGGPHNAPARTEPRRRLPIARIADDWNDGWIGNRWLWLLLVAIFLHAYLARVPVERFSLFEPKPTVRDPVAVELLSKSRPVVMTERATVEPSKDDDKPAEFAGEFRNRTARQTRAETTGQFREFRPSGGTQRRQRGSSDRSRNEEGEEEASRIASLGLSDLMPQNAASPYRLPDNVAAGVRTVLNTDSVVHAGFFNRIASAIYDGWVAQAQMAIERLRIQGKILPTNDYVTKIAIEIDTDGNLREVRLLESCGVPLLDDAPKKAFWDAQPFRNPPKGLFQGEPTFIIPFQFHYQWRTSGINFGRSSP